MMYLYGYLGMGVVALAIVFGAHLLQKKDELQALLAQMDADRLARQTRFMQFLENYVVPVVTGMAVVVGWPVALIMAAKGVFENFTRRKAVTSADPEASQAFEMPGEFAVGRQHLQVQFTVQAVEARERVVDPLNAVPDLPFGHLNGAWQAFLGGLAEDGSLWSFTAHWQDHWQRRELRCGYVWVHDDKPGIYFQTMCKKLS